MGLLFLFVTHIGFAAHIVLNNQTLKPTKDQQSTIIIQWATSAKDAEENNLKVRQGIKLNPDSLQTLTQTGILNLIIPKKAEYFRVLVWSKGKRDPDLLTNWVDVVPNKTYTLNEDHLIPFILMAGAGC